MSNPISRVMVARAAEAMVCARDMRRGAPRGRHLASLPQEAFERYFDDARAALEAVGAGELLASLKECLDEMSHNGDAAHVRGRAVAAIRQAEGQPGEFASHSDVEVGGEG